jgi:hypothetical protein
VCLINRHERKKIKKNCGDYNNSIVLEPGENNDKQNWPYGRPSGPGRWAFLNCYVKFGLAREESYSGLSLVLALFIVGSWAHKNTGKKLRICKRTSHAELAIGDEYSFFKGQKHYRLVY